MTVTEQIRASAQHIRDIADTAAANTDGDELCCWEWERLRGHERVVALRTGPDGDNSAVIAVPTEPGVAEHIALWDPTIAHAVAELLDRAADCGQVKNMAAMRAEHAALTLAKLLDTARDHGATS